jgi:hypothetical protein
MQLPASDRSPMGEGRATLREALRFCKVHGVHALLLPLAVVGFTALHESAHALAAIIQGGRIVDFVVWPGDGEWGHVQYSFLPGVGYSSLAISLAPYMMWAGMMVVVALTALRSRPWPFWLASALFVWGYAGAFGDILYAWIGWLAGAPNDFARAIGPAGLEVALAVAVVSLSVVYVGYRVQRRLYRSAALAPAAYGLLTALAAVALAASMVLAP